MESLWIWGAVYFLTVLVTQSLAKVHHPTVSLTTNISTQTRETTPTKLLNDVFTEQRTEYFQLSSSVNLTCISVNTTSQPILFITWNLKSNMNDCRIATGDGEAYHDTCLDGRKLENSTSGEPYLHIPHFSREHEGVYQCETVWRGGGQAALITVSAMAVLQVEVWLDRQAGEAVCLSTSDKPGASISWRAERNTTQLEVTQQTHSPHRSKHVTESRAKLTEPLYGSHLTCVVSHPTWKEEQEKVIEVSSDASITAPWKEITVSIIVVVVLIGVLAGLLIIRKHLGKIRNCCKISISRPPACPAAKPEDVEEVEPYASYIQRVNSIYNSSAELFND